MAPYNPAAHAAPVALVVPARGATRSRSTAATAHPRPTHQRRSSGRGHRRRRRRSSWTPVRSRSAPRRTRPRCRLWTPPGTSAPLHTRRCTWARTTTAKTRSTPRRRAWAAPPSQCRTIQRGTRRLTPLRSRRGSTGQVSRYTSPRSCWSCTTRCCHRIQGRRASQCWRWRQGDRSIPRSCCRVRPAGESTTTCAPYTAGAAADALARRAASAAAHATAHFPRTRRNTKHQFRHKVLDGS